MIGLSDDEHLRPDEDWARQRLETAIGPTRVTDRKGGPERQHDLEADLPDGTIAAIEITSEADPARRRAAARARKYLSGVTIPGSQFWWLIQLTPLADARLLNKRGLLVALLTSMDRQGQSSASALADSRDPWRDQLEALGIQSVHGIAGSGHQGTVSVMPDFVVAWGWVRRTADEWIVDFLASKLGKDHIDKLERADAAERHLVILFHPDTEAGIGIAGAVGELSDRAVSDYLPSVVPPEPLTDLWLLAPTVPPKALRWTRVSGWSVVDLSG